MGWEDWYKDQEFDPGLFSLKDLLIVFYIPLTLIFGFFLIASWFLYVIWLGVEEIVNNKRKQKNE